MGSTSDPARADAALLARLSDLAERAKRSGRPQFWGFLDAHQAVVADGGLRRLGLPYRLYGGYPDAERVTAGVFPPKETVAEEAFPVRAVAFFSRREASFSHRDVLGALMSAGVRREKLGDILCGEGLAVVMTTAELVPFLTDQIDRIGGESVRAEANYTGELPALHRFRPLSGTVASPRLDAVLKWLLASAREPAAELIRGGLVSVNHCVCQTASHMLKEQDVLSVRGAGRFRIETIGPETQKGRLHIAAVQYI